jgi:hypothetical protein
MENAPSNINPDAITDPINKITLEFLMNRSKYKKYIEKVDPSKHRENEKHLHKIWKYKNRILNLTNDLLDNPDRMITLDVGDCFHSYMRTLIRYFEMKDMEKHDSDVLFDDIDNDDDQDISKTSPTHCYDRDTIRQQRIAYNILPRHLDTTYNGRFAEPSGTSGSNLDRSKIGLERSGVVGVSKELSQENDIITTLLDKENKPLSLVNPGEDDGLNEEFFKEYNSNIITPIMKSFWGGNTFKKTQSNITDFSINNRK